MADSILAGRQIKITREYDLREMRETIEAIRTGLVDALVIESDTGCHVHALHPLESVEELHDTMQAIRGGRVDALVVKTPSGDRVFSLQETDEPYRVLIEMMSEGAATVDADGIILYANAHFTELLGVASEALIGASIYSRLQTADEEELRRLMEAGLRETTKGGIGFSDPQGRSHSLHLVLSPLRNYDQAGRHAVCIVAVDVTELFEANESLRKQEGALRELSACLLQSQDDERRRISRELHDSAGQYLAAAQMRLARIETEMSKSQQPEPLRSLASDALEAVSECAKEIRTLSYLLHPPTLDYAGLASAVDWYSEGFSARSGIQVDLEISPDFGRLPEDLELAIYRVVQESLTNIHRHSGSKWARIQLSRDGDAITLEIADRGKGMSNQPTHDSPRHTGVGISGMRERVRQLNGQLAIESGHQGTTVRATFREEKHAAAAQQ